MAMNNRLMRPIAEPGTAPLAYSASLLLHFDGNFTDSSSNSFLVTANGDAAISTGQAKFGSGSAYFDGDSDYLSISDPVAQLGAGNFTVEFWTYPVTLNDYTVLLGNYTDAPSDHKWQLLMNGSGSLDLYDANSGFSGVAVPIVTDAWQHIALVRNAGALTIYLNGESAGVAQNAYDFSSDSAMWIGRVPENVEGRWFNGYIDDLRIVKGLAVYTGPFTPPTSPLTAVATPHA